MEHISWRWARRYPLSRFASVAITAALPGAFLVLTRSYPTQWATRHETQIANALHVLALITVANQRMSVQDLLVVTLVMLSVEAFRRSSRDARHEHDGKGAPTETGPSPMRSAIVQTDLDASSIELSQQASPESHVPHSAASTEEKDEEIQRLQKSLTEVQTAKKQRETDLKRTQTDLQNARETMNETFAEYTSLRDEMKTMKQSIGRDHQAIVYRKDIELFALRKSLEQKENIIGEKNAKLDSARTQFKTALDLKESQVRSLKERLATIEQSQTPHMNGDTKFPGDGEHHAALQVKLLRVRGRSSLEESYTSDEKDMEIARLKEDLSVIKNGSATLSRVQDELRRAWDTTNEIQKALNRERNLHVQTREKLEETVVRLEEELRKTSQRSSPTTRLPTIEESDKQELEAMFNAAQQDNLRLYSEHEAMDKRLREANARLFSAEQELGTLREQLNVEKAITEDMETARPSLVHRVHFQRLEGQLKESRDALVGKDDEITQLQKTLEAKDGHAENLKKEKETAEAAQATLQEELNRSKKSIAELESTKEQLMLDHERLAQHRSRQRLSTSEQPTSARYSGMTLITDTSPLSTGTGDSDAPLPARPMSLAETSSIQATPERVHAASTPTSSHPDRTDTNSFSIISHDIPPPEIRNTRRKSLTLKGLMRKMAGKDSDEKAKELATDTKPEKQQPRPRTALQPKDRNVLLRPRTAVPNVPALAKPIPTNEAERPKTGFFSKAELQKDRHSTSTGDESLIRPETSSSQQYYDAVSSATRPKTALEEKEEREFGSMDRKVDVLEGSANGNGRPKSRGWSVSRKLVRKATS